MKTILITGITGYIAQYLLLTRPAGIRLIGTRRSADHDFLKADGEKIETQTLFLENNVAAQLNDLQPDIVIHGAAMAGLGQCEQQDELANRVNSEASKELSRWCVERNCRMVYLSTDIVFKGDRPPYQEADQPDPINTYGKTKFLGELFVQEALSDYAVCRISLALGKGLSGTNNFIDWFSTKLAGCEPVTLFEDEIRTATYAPDLARKIWQIAQSTDCGIFHLAGGQSLSRLQLGELICDELGHGHELLKAMALADKTDYPRPADVSLKSTRLVDGKKLTIAGIESFIPKIARSLG